MIAIDMPSEVPIGGKALAAVPEHAHTGLGVLLPVLAKIKISNHIRINY